MKEKILIIGAGPTGLGAAYRLQELGYNNWEIYEKNNYVGGLSASFRDDKGFTWDIGGHVMFSHYTYFDKLVDRLLNNDYLEHLRESWIWTKNRFVPYPFQNNIRYLPKKDVLECLLGLVGAVNNSENSKNFKDWIITVFGEGIARHFMIPYNEKMWAFPLEKMSKDWIADRVSVVDFKKVLKNVIYERDDVSWGPNSTFKFPLYGGTGGLFNRFVPHIKEKLYLNKEVSEIDIWKKKIFFSDGTSEDYDFLINTMPLDHFVDRSNLKEFYGDVKNLKYNSVAIVGVGIKKECPSTKCWMYFPGSESPFYRVTYFSNYSPNNVPNRKYYSLMAESSYSDFKPIAKEEIIEETIRGMINTKLLNKKDREKIVSSYLIDAKYAYPIPTLNRDKALEKIQPFLMENGIYSRGRFGAWKYEIGNMDHSVMQGIEVVDRILHGKEEDIFRL